MDLSSFHPRSYGLASCYVLSLVLAACCPDKPVDCRGSYHFHTSFPEEWKTGALQGVANWDTFAGTHTILEGVSDDEVCSFRAPAWGGAEYLQIKSDFGEDFMAAHWSADGSVLITQGPWTQACVENLSNCVVGSVMHEMGHAHGLRHVTGAAVMNPETVKDEYTESDRAECIRVGTCRNESLAEFEQGAR